MTWTPLVSIVFVGVVFVCILIGALAGLRDAIKESIDRGEM